MRRGILMAEFGRDAALQEAARWFARCHRAVMTIEEKTEFEIWRSKPGNAAAMDELEGAWELTGLARGHFARPAEHIPAVQRTFARTAVLAVMCVLSLGVGIVSYTGHSAFWTSLDWVQR